MVLTKIHQTTVYDGEFDTKYLLKFEGRPYMTNPGKVEILLEPSDLPDLLSDLTKLMREAGEDAEPAH